VSVSMRARSEKQNGGLALPDEEVTRAGADTRPATIWMQMMQTPDQLTGQLVI
jgi:hypothetical protein